jgi:hypothetical protein
VWLSHESGTFKISIDRFVPDLYSQGPGPCRASISNTIPENPVTQLTDARKLQPVYQL